MITWGPEVTTFRTKALNFSGYTFKLIGKSLIWWGPAIWLSRSILACWTRINTAVRENAKETETDETLGLLVFIFIIGGISIGGAGLLAPLWLRPWQGRFTKASLWKIPFVYCLRNFNWIYSKGLLSLERFSLMHFSLKHSLQNILNSKTFLLNKFPVEYLKNGCKIKF